MARKRADDAQLVVESGESERVSFRLEPVSTLGRDPTSTVRVLDEQLSRRHAVLRRGDGYWTIEDQGSTNGTYVNEARCERATLRGGERIRAGSTIFRFVWLARG